MSPHSSLCEGTRIPTTTSGILSLFPPGKCVFGQYSHPPVFRWFLLPETSESCAHKLVTPFSLLPKGSVEAATIHRFCPKQSLTCPGTDPPLSTAKNRDYRCEPPQTAYLVLLWRLSWPGTHCISQAGLFPVSASECWDYKGMSQQLWAKLNSDRGQAPQ